MLTSPIANANKNVNNNYYCQSAKDSIVISMNTNSHDTEEVVAGTSLKEIKRTHSEAEALGANFLILTITKL